MALRAKAPPRPGGNHNRGRLQDRTAKERAGGTRYRHQTIAPPLYHRGPGRAAAAPGIT
ncbi:hypothetical protein GCM10010245_20140 [Streptomyces spectabilis]|nr:hypothetical protein GCM10010245_20140 [Streptomyces spectabilis]